MKKIIPSLLFLLTAICCTKNETSEVTAAMKDYTRQMATTQPDSISDMYSLKGQISGEGQKAVIGRDSIRAMFESFSGYVMLKYTTTVDSVANLSDSVVLAGTYRQNVVTPSRDTLDLGGAYRASWIKQNGRWVINSMYTHSYRSF